MIHPLIQQRLVGYVEKVLIGFGDVYVINFA